MLRFVFFATGANFSLRVLENLVELNHLPGMIVVPEYPPSANIQDNVFELTQTQNLNPLADYARRFNIPLHYAPRNNELEISKVLRREQFDFLLVACWPYKISAAIYSQVSKAAVNLHPSLLPAYRGKSPVLDQLRNQEKRLGVSLHLLSDEFDAGDIVASNEFELCSAADSAIIEEIAAKTGVELFIRSCTRYDGPEWSPVPQSDP